MAKTKKRVLHLTRKDFIRQTFHCGGHGGQGVNKVETGVRFIHPASGARGEACDERKQGQNEKIAFRRMAKSPKMRVWIAEQHQNQVRGRSVEEEVATMMADENIQVEVKDAEGNWMVIDQ